MRGPVARGLARMEGIWSVGMRVEQVRLGSGLLPEPHTQDLHLGEVDIFWMSFSGVTEEGKKNKAERFDVRSYHVVCFSVRS